jgi:hypothetical protein
LRALIGLIFDTQNIGRVNGRNQSNHVGLGRFR